jgi:hypothetical protein
LGGRDTKNGKRVRRECERKEGKKKDERKI